MSEAMIPARVRTMRHEAERVLSVELVPLRGVRFPSFEPGAHIDLHLDNGMVRSYSLLNSPSGSRDEKHHYTIAVLDEPQGRGGSRYVHTSLRCGMEVRISNPRNHFALDGSARHSVLIAGGIGITPILSMYRHLRSLGRSVDLVYAARSRDEAAFVDELASTGGDIRLHFSGQCNGSRLDIAAVLANQPEGVHAYCCGPSSMLDAFEAACDAAGITNVHVERFRASSASLAKSAVLEGTYEVTLARSGRCFPVSRDVSLLESLLQHNVDVDFSCSEGICGACIVNVLEGDVLHRDSVLDGTARASGTVMMVCVSHGACERLVLDL